MDKFKNWFRSSPRSSGTQPAQDPPPAATAPQAKASNATQTDSRRYIGEVNSVYAKKWRKEIDAKSKKSQPTSASKHKPLVSANQDEGKKISAKIQPVQSNKRRAFVPTLETIPEHQEHQEHQETPERLHEVRAPDLPASQPRPSLPARRDPPEVINGVITPPTATETTPR